MITFSTADLWAWAAAGLFPFLRVAALFTSAPLLSHRAVPQRVRIGAALAIAACVALATPGVPPPSGDAFLGAALEQVAVGLAMGFTMQLVFAAAELAGDLIGLQMGLGFATLFDPQGGGQTPVLAGLFSTAALLLFLGMDGHLVLIGTVAESFRDLPPGAVFAKLDPSAFAASGALVFSLGVKLALPALAGLLLVNLAFGVIARVSPQLNIFSVGFPATLLAGIALLVVSAPAWLAGIQGALASALATLGR